MKAARFHAREDVRIDDIPEPEPTDGTVKIKVDWCGICGTDLHECLEGPIFTPVTGSPHPLTGEVAPVQLGHEFAGHITEVGSGVTGFSEGDAVAVEPTLFCGRCAECRAGLTGLVDRAERRGLAERAPVPGDRRALRVTLTDAGRQAAAAFHAEVTAELSQLLSPLASQDREQFRTAMAKITQAAGRTAGWGAWPAC
jgi:threonine dehydrogenase-like Zn-dependent dehydrogenase